tara:strand:- start:142 stop:528 length:387 start_codon:yes stop_codon:yes gene_type:complete
MTEEIKDDWNCSVECLTNLSKDEELTPNRHFLLLGAELGEETIELDTCIVRGNNLSILNLFFKAAANNKSLAEILISAAFELKIASYELKDFEDKLKDTFIESLKEQVKSKNEEQVESSIEDVESSEG